MNTIRRVWENPAISIQVFAPQECVAACSRISGSGNRYFDFLTTRVYTSWSQSSYVLGYYDSGEQASWYRNELIFSSDPGFTEWDNIKVYTGYTNTRDARGYTVREYNGSGTIYPKIQIRYEGRTPTSGTKRYYVYNATS